MKKLVFAGILATMFAGALAFGTPTTFKKHKGKTGKDGVKVTCNYCHKNAGVEKKKGQNIPALRKGPYCALPDCHG